MNSNGSLSKLSKRQYECVILAAKGLSAKEIARLLDISPRTVETHLDILREKLNARNRMQLCCMVKSILSFNRPVEKG